jgi:hypothetical protein
MKKIRIIFLLNLLLMSASALKAQQSMTLSNLEVAKPAIGKHGDTTFSIGVHCNVSAPVVGATVLLLAGTAKDRHNVGLEKGAFLMEHDQWIILSKDAHYKDGKLSMNITIPLKDRPRTKELSLYVTDKSGKVISNELYYSLP